MRVTGGSLRGRRLQAVPGTAVRPTTDRLREAVFAMLGDSLPRAAVADLCCGSGTLGIEALSRGAAHVDFVDLAPACLQTVRRNLLHCGLAEERWRLHRADAVRWLRRRLAAGGPPLIVLADPPYGGPVAPVLAELLAAAGPTRLAAAVLEHEPPPAWRPPAGHLEPGRLETRTYGRSAVTLFRPAPRAALEDDHA